MYICINQPDDIILRTFSNLPISDRLDPVPIFGALSVANRYFL